MSENGNESAILYGNASDIIGVFGVFSVNLLKFVIVFDMWFYSSIFVSEI